MVSLPEQLARVVLQYYPRAICFTCLASELNIPEPDLRSAAQMLMREAFKTDDRTCFRCSLTTMVLLPDKETPS